MASRSERTFGSRIANAATLATQLSEFTAYAAVRPEDSIANFKTLIADIKTMNVQVATKRADYSNAVESRQGAFTKNPDALSKILTLVAAQVRAKFGKKSKEAKDMAAMIKKINGNKTRKTKKQDQSDYVSTSARSYGSRTTYFSDILSTLIQYGSDYAPVNDKIKIGALSDLLLQLNALNVAVSDTWALLKPAIDQRHSLYDELTDRAMHIKDGVKTQYGSSSSEFKLVKGLKF